ncbi:GIY-YIG nuclease family protein [Paenarthrobacter sp. AT5]|uniref:GIY-YIG nuclease family protein n=1 Tax=Paenarthrobacter TaxID=1742992 RepID=UPI001F60C04D|nr:MULTISPECIES: GIY-YIG nuclease family protein [Paenarthrobacter]WOC62739.1 GIY-YIG nuclease family protein [Paenarthrobacter sp. AT5]
MDIVNEIGDASVLFRFDGNALFDSDDALATEALLYLTFAEQRVNKVNLRHEFFRITPHQVLEVLKEHHVELVEADSRRHSETCRAAADGLCQAMRRVDGQCECTGDRTRSFYSFDVQSRANVGIGGSLP